MRPIKFRAWDKEIKQWVLIWEDFSLENGELTHYDKDALVLMQFTGLLDRNGKEIYEGDTVKLGTLKEEDEENIEAIEKVFFSDGRFITTHHGFPVSSWAKNENCYIEVIGNIYENPDILK